MANIRSAYAEASTAMLVSDGKAVPDPGNGVVVSAKADDDTQQVTVNHVELKGQIKGFSGLAEGLPFNVADAVDLGDDSAIGGAEGTYTATFKWDLDKATCELTSLTKNE